MVLTKNDKFVAIYNDAYKSVNVGKTLDNGTFTSLVVYVNCNMTLFTCINITKALNNDA